MIQPSKEKYTSEQIKAAWPSCIDYCQEDADRLAALASEKEISKCNLNIWIRNNAVIKHTPPVEEPVGRNWFACPDDLYMYRSRTPFGFGTGGGTRVIRSGKEMT